jgi:hypothetical protein
MQWVLRLLSCALLVCSGLVDRAAAQVALVPPGSVWKYLDTGANLGTGWPALNYDDRAWPAGRAQLGYGDGDEATVVSFGPDPNAKYITTYFRRAFIVADPGAFTNLVLGLLRDDGAVVYLNGTEVARQNMPAGTITYTTLASAAVAGADETRFFTTNLPPSVLRAGTNLLAVEVHQSSASSSDLSFDLFLGGFTASPNTNLLRFYVATNGNDEWSGTVPEATGADGPLATLHRARDLVRFYAANGWLPPGGAVIEVAGGVYPLARTLDLTSLDSGTPQAPILWRARAGQQVRLTGGRTVTGWWRVSDEATLARLDPAARGRVWAADLRAQGITNFTAPTPGTTWAQSDPGIELFFQDKPMTLARYPNDGWLKILKALGPTTNDIRGTIGTVEGIFSCADDRLDRWVGEPDVMVHGYWFWDWADQRHKVASIDAASNIITIFTNATYRYHTYGYRDGQWFYAYNLLPELDAPGEWYLDRASGVLYFWPPAPLDQGEAMVSQLATLLTLTNASHITFQGFIFEGCQKDAILISGGATNCVRACTVRNVGKNAVRITDSPGSGVTGCDIYFTGDGGISLSGGDRATLTPAGLYAEDNHIHHYSRWNPVYHAGISLSGVGQRVAHNLIHDAPHEGIAFGGNDHLIEFNEFHSLVSESNDAGVIYGGRTWTARGHLIRYNYFHHIYGFERRGCNCVYLDDQFSSATVYGNLFFEVPTAILIGGGRDNLVLNNLFVNCRRALSLDARGLGWATNAWGTLTNDLLRLPYQTPPWSARYPALTNILNEDPMAPRGNVVARNVSWMGGWAWIESAAQAGVTSSNNLVNVDPLLVDSNRLDFRLQTNSPAFGLGFEPLPLDQIGPRTNLEHAPWPPSATLVRPVHQAVFGRPTAVPLEAVVSDPARVAERVEFMVGRAMLAATAQFPFRFTWSNPPPGHYSLDARVVHGAGAEPGVKPVTIHVQDALVAAGSVWKYLDNGSNQGTAWRASDFDDRAWPSGPAELGYGDEAEDRPEATRLSYGPNPNNKYITYYFRRAFTVADPGRYTNLVLGVLRDDGAIVYLNGQEIRRDNLPTGTVTYTTPALSAVSGSDETVYHETALDPALLRPGTNVLAVEIHQVSPSSSDISFDLYLHGQMGLSLADLQAQRVGPAVQLSWPIWAWDCALEVAADLLSGAWGPMPGEPVVLGHRVGLQVQPVGRQAFFRLASP